MAILERFLKRIGYSKAASRRELDQLISSVYSGNVHGVTSDRPYSALVDGYKSWVYTAVDKISKTVAMLPVELYVYRSRSTGKKAIVPGSVVHELKMIKGGDRAVREKEIGLEREPLEDHPFLDLINRPNGTMTRMLLWYETMLRMELAGMCCWYVAMNKAGLPGEIWPLPLTKTAEIRVKVSGTAQIEYWNYQDGAVVQKFEPKEIVFMHYPNPGNPWIGFSPLQAQTYPYDIDLYMMISQRNLYERGAMPGMNLHTNQPLSPDQVKDMMDWLNANYAGATKAGFPIVTHSGLELKNAAFTPKDALLQHVAKWAREKLITAYDLSEGKLGLVSDVNRANAEALDVTFVRECLQPKCLLIEEAIETFLLPAYDEGLTLDFQLPDVANREMDVTERVANLGSFVTTINEERSKMGLGEVEWGDRPWMPMSVVQEGAEPVIPAPLAVATPQIADEEEEDAGKAVGTKAAPDWDEGKKKDSGNPKSFARFRGRRSSRSR